MVFVNIYWQPLYRDFKADLFSLAVIFQATIFCITIGVPIALVAINPDSWPMYTTSYEQPSVKYQRMAIAHLNLDDGSSISWSTIPNYNQLRGSSNRAATLKVKDEDSNKDSKIDLFRFSLDVPVTSNEHVFGFTLLLFFDYRIQYRTSYEMSTVVVIQHSSASSGSSFYADGFLELTQQLPLKQGVTDEISKPRLINQSSQVIEDYSLQLLSAKILDRSLQTKFVSSFPIWTTGETSGQPFHMEIAVRIPPTAVWIQTSILHRFATAGSQFIFWLILFWIGAWWLCYFMFSQKVIPSIRQPEQYSIKRYLEQAEERRKLVNE